MADGWCCCWSRRFVNSGFILRHTRLIDVPEVQLDTTRMGKLVREIVIVSEHRTIYNTSIGNVIFNAAVLVPSV